jgi:Dullard-like phosphatase family protein
MPTSLIDLKSFAAPKSLGLIKVKIDDHKHHHQTQGIEKIMEMPGEEEESSNARIKGFVIDSSGSDSGSSSDSNSASDGEEELKREMEGLVDDELTTLLLHFDTLPRPTPEELAVKKLTFGTASRQKTLILDMDETLIHAKLKSSVGDSWGEDFTITVTDDEGEPMVFAVKNRPCLIECLERISQFYEICVFTAAEKSYAEQIVAKFDPERKWVSHLLSREHCFNSAGFLVKDLRIISDRRMQDIIIIDNSIVCFAFNLDNGVPISPYLGDNELDEELIFMTSYLEDVYHHEDARVANM